MSFITDTINIFTSYVVKYANYFLDFIIGIPKLFVDLYGFLPFPFNIVISSIFPIIIFILGIKLVKALLDALPILQEVL